MMKKVVILGIAASLAAGLAGCSSGDPDEQPCLDFLAAFDKDQAAFSSGGRVNAPWSHTYIAVQDLAKNDAISSSMRENARASVPFFDRYFASLGGEHRAQEQAMISSWMEILRYCEKYK